MSIQDKKALNNGYPEASMTKYPHWDSDYDAQIIELADTIRDGQADGETVWTIAKKILDKNYRKMED